ncbi:MAG TPA: CoA transferase [Xanthobacteraceae bacterium]|jgi:crotonobetainyl-CoA:carnitine CoA-transferase CaiB-like acyl-CoA transferase
MTRLPLHGITVIELGHSVAAPYACEILGDLGADVIKIEKADGDDARKWAPPYWGAMSATFQSFNRNKRSVVVNLRDPGERERLRKLVVERADIVVQNLRPGSAAEFGLDAQSLRSLKPSLIYCTIGAFGATGPLKSRPGYDPLMQAFGGLMSVTGEPQQPPVRVGTSVIDMATGMWSVIGVLSALMQRREHGDGSSIDTSLFETALGWMCYHAANYQASGELPQRQGSGAAMIVPYRGYASKDGFIVIAAGNDKLFASLARVLRHPEWIEDARFRTNPDRVKNQDALYRAIEQLIATRTSREWAAVLDEAGVPNAPMQTIAEVLDHPQTKALEILQPSPQGDITLVGLPVSFDGARPAFRRAPPSLGEHTQEILGEPLPAPAAVKE